MDASLNESPDDLPERKLGNPVLVIYRGDDGNDNS
jgi:hypothetical protein